MFSIKRKDHSIGHCEDTFLDEARTELITDWLRQIDEHSLSTTSHTIRFSSTIALLRVRISHVHFALLLLRLYAPHHPFIVHPAAAGSRSPLWPLGLASCILPIGSFIEPNYLTQAHYPPRCKSRLYTLPTYPFLTCSGSPRRISHI